MNYPLDDNHDPSTDALALISDEELTRCAGGLPSNPWPTWLRLPWGPRPPRPGQVDDWIKQHTRPDLFRPPVPDSWKTRR